MQVVQVMLRREGLLRPRGNEGGVMVQAYLCTLLFGGSMPLTRSREERIGILKHVVRGVYLMVAVRHPEQYNSPAKDGI